ncbi:MAG TPA: ribose 5-phosphate isomerase B [Bacilli bacterium]|jgi:ribose 5-phosphate isomerase B|nr:MAG: Ribose-5-phosphate isomerase B [Tenericutes bacterium ADurb.Bin140]HOE78379.1 ribose 5-phosphate isomerase B [Bacilli bacterium]HOR96049.1 ribose 5-phosphate isomerase B [Bacilli bacterium]HPD12153.1 ribose 5-phosphate isomerase B [Bacilli bacterium]HPK58223.1 ribose 5-phosphate isomerase B [Bacilli bacterium]
MKISIGSDHAGFKLKEALVAYLAKKHQVLDMGTYSDDSVDYPDYAFTVSKQVADREVDFGILICYTGIGMSISANKVKGIRAALVLNVESAKLTREHNNANVLCLAAKDTPLDLAKQIVDTFLNTAFLGERHERRVDKICRFEEN